MELRDPRVAASGAALALMLGLGAGLLGRAPLDRALAFHPMVPVPGTSQIAANTLPLTEAPPPPPAAPTTVTERDDTPIVATDDDPPDDPQVALADQTQVDTPVAAPAPVEAQAPQTPPPSPRRDFNFYRKAPPDYPPTWAYQGPPRWGPPPPPPPDYDPD